VGIICDILAEDIVCNDSIDVTLVFAGRLLGVIIMQYLILLLILAKKYAIVCAMRHKVIDKLLDAIYAFSVPGDCEFCSRSSTSDRCRRKKFWCW